MSKILAPSESETIEKQRQHLEMIVLLVAHHIYHAVDRIVAVAEFRSADVLGHID